MNCPQCGYEPVPTDARFCPGCGQPVPQAPAGATLVQVTQDVERVQKGTVTGVSMRQVIGDVYVGAKPEDKAEALRVYRRVLVHTARHLPLRGIDLGASDATPGRQRFNLTEVYVELDTTTAFVGEGVQEWRIRLSAETEEARGQEQKSARVRQFSTLEAVIANRRLVILGGPGSGKSTFLSHMALCLAAHGLDPGAGWLDRLSGWPAGESDAIPILLALRDFYQWLPEGSAQGKPCHLWDFITAQLTTQNLSSAAEPLRKMLELGKVIILLDGLDEVPGSVQQASIRDAVVAFAERYPENRLVVTCRTSSYQDRACHLDGFSDFELAPFDRNKINRFIVAWYAELARLGVCKLEEARELGCRLQGAISSPDLWRLASNPLLLTVMALVHTHKGSLPDARSLLFEETVDILLWRWEQIRAGGEEMTPELRRLLLEVGRTDVALKRVLWQLAFEAHQKTEVGEEGTLTDIDKLHLLEMLARLHPKGSLDWAQQMIDAMKLRAGLLQEPSPGVFVFPHPTFQEYLAGAHLSVQADFARQAAQLLQEGTLWREVVLLAVGRLVHLSGDSDKPLALVGELCPAKVVDNDLAWRMAKLAGEVLLEVGLNLTQDSVLGQDLTERVRCRLASLVHQGRLSPIERVAVGDALAHLGDGRSGVGLDSTTGLPRISWCWVSAGSFVLGSTDDPLVSGHEKPQRRVELPYGYWISGYPITNAQFGSFVADGGYNEQHYWQEAEADGSWESGQVKTKWDEKWRDRPVDPGEPFNLANHPVVNVSWYEAMAFSRWLEERLRERGDLEPEDEVRLPTEAEWEKAARGGLEVPKQPEVSESTKGLRDGMREGELYPNSNPTRRHPWGDMAGEDDLNSNRANYTETGIGATSAVGCFPSGCSPYGVLDLSGNVWEWCQTVWLHDYWEYDSRLARCCEDRASRVVRGGAFSSNRWFMHCACRSRNDPGYWDRNCGFRLVLAPTSSCQAFKSTVISSTRQRRDSGFTYLP